MKGLIRFSLLVVLLGLLPGLAGGPALAQEPVVRAVLFFSPTCPHCHEVITEDLPLFFYVKEPSGAYIAASMQFCEIIDRSQDEVLGRTDHEIFPKELADKQVSEDNLVIEQDEPLDVGEWAFDREGERMIFHMRKMPFKDEMGDLVGVIGIAFDITERKRMEGALTESEARYSMLADAPFEAIAFHEHGKIIEANKAFYELAGYTPEEILGQDFVQFIAPESQKTVAKKLKDKKQSPE